MWREICNRARGVIIHIRWMIGDGYTADFFHDPWISDLPLNRRPIFVSMKIGGIVKISELMHSGRGGWHGDQVVPIFGLDLASRVLFIAIPTIMPRM